MGQKPHTLFANLSIYQIYLRSFQDTTGNGIGDLKGVVQRLDYLKWLGVTAIWISPFYPSPMADFGYDVADYCNVDPVFGTLQDFDELLTQAHQRGIKLIIDFVPNHTSDQHAWFEQSRRSKDSPKRAWYVWRDPKPDGSPPNNWLSAFGGSAWELDPTTGQYYLHSFLKEQPDLNWQHKPVRSAMKQVMRFWLARGVDGLRVDAVYWLGKDPQYRNDLKNPDYNPETQQPYESLLHVHSKRQASLYEYLKEMAQVAKSYGNRFLLSEAYPHKRFGYSGYLSFYQKVEPAVLLPFNFESIFLPWQAANFQKYINGFQARLHSDYVPVYAMGNHDKPRLATRIGHAEARSAALLLLTLPGVPLIYYGDEIGMSDVPIPKHRTQDPFNKNTSGPYEGRDPERTPMQWSSQQYAGFSSAPPWLPLARDHRSRNVEQEAKDPQSMLNLYKRLLTLHTSSDAIKLGSYRSLHFEDPNMFGFVRQYQDERLAIVINFSKTNAIPLEMQGKLILSTHELKGDQAAVLPLEGRIIAI